MREHLGAKAAKAPLQFATRFPKRTLVEGDADDMDATLRELGLAPDGAVMMLAAETAAGAVNGAASFAARRKARDGKAKRGSAAVRARARARRWAVSHGEICDGYSRSRAVARGRGANRRATRRARTAVASCLPRSSSSRFASV